MKTFIAYALTVSGLPNLVGYFFGMIISVIAGRIVWLFSPEFRKSPILWASSEKKKIFEICMGIASGFGAVFAAALIFHLLRQHLGLAVLLIIIAWKITPNGFEWVPITVSGDDLKARCSFHQDDAVDVAIVSIEDLLRKVMYPVPVNEKPMIYSAVSEDNFPGKGKITVEVGDDALVVGYPRGFYDKFSKFPIVKSGVIASFWGMPTGVLGRT